MPTDEELLAESKKYRRPVTHTAASASRALADVRRGIASTRNAGPIETAMAQGEGRSDFDQRRGVLREMGFGDRFRQTRDNMAAQSVERAMAQAELQRQQNAAKATGAVDMATAATLIPAQAGKLTADAGKTTAEAEKLIPAQANQMNTQASVLMPAQAAELQSKALMQTATAQQTIPAEAARTTAQAGKTGAETRNLDAVTGQVIPAQTRQMDANSLLATAQANAMNRPAQAPQAGPTGEIDQQIQLLEQQYQAEQSAGKRVKIRQDIARLQSQRQGTLLSGSAQNLNGMAPGAKYDAPIDLTPDIISQMKAGKFKPENGSFFRAPNGKTYVWSDRKGDIVEID
jgi:hypothetical protein